METIDIIDDFDIPPHLLPLNSTSNLLPDLCAITDMWLKYAINATCQRDIIYNMTMAGNSMYHHMNALKIIIDDLKSTP
jgi:hypothetical protein